MLGAHADNPADIIGIFGINHRIRRLVWQISGGMRVLFANAVTGEQTVTKTLPKYVGCELNISD